MKITGLEGQPQVRPGPPHSPDSPGSADFNKLLRESLEPDDTETRIQKKAPLAEPRSIQNIGRLSPLPSEFESRTARVIDLMDRYAQSLSDPGKTLKDIEPDLLKFIEEARSLHETYLKTENTDTRLTRIMEDLHRTSRLEAVRFQRGDYLDSE